MLRRGDSSWLWVKFAFFSCHSIIYQGSPSFLVLTVNELCLLFLRQCFTMLMPSTETWISGTSLESPDCIEVSRHVYWRISWRCDWRVQSGVRVGGEKGSVGGSGRWRGCDAKTCMSVSGERDKWVVGICWDSSWLRVKFAFFSCHSIISGFFRLLFWCWLWMNPAFFSCHSVLRGFRLQPCP